MNSLILLLRPHQWLKNLFVFMPLFFDRHLFDDDYLTPCVWVFIAYCFAASGIYCFNDIYDVELDKIHPVKSKRPIASGAVNKPTAYSLMLLCFLVSFLVIIRSLAKIMNNFDGALTIIIDIFIFNITIYIFHIPLLP